MAGELSGETSALLRRLDLDERVGPVFAREGIDEDSLPCLSVEDLVGVGVAAEDARRIVSAVAVPDAEPVEAVAVPSAPRGHCVMSTMLPRHVSAEDKPLVGPYVDRLFRNEFKDLSGGDSKKCYNEAVRKAVQDKFTWPHPPGGAFLFQELQKLRARAKAPEAPKPPKRRAPRARSPPPAERSATDEDEVVTACRRAAGAVDFDEATQTTTIKNKCAVVDGLRAVSLCFTTGAITLVADPAAAAVTLMGRVAGWPDGVLPPGHIGDFFTKVVQMSDADRDSLVERTAKAESERLGQARGWTGETAKCSEPAPAPAKSAPLAGTSVVVAEPQTKMVAAAQHALRALNCLTQVTKKGKEQSISQVEAFSVAASAIGLRPNFQGLCKSAESLDTYVSKLVTRVALPASAKEAPESWEALLQYVVSLPESEQGVLFAQTRLAEDERVWKLTHASLVGPARREQIKQRRERVEASRLLDDECQRWVDELMANAQKVDEDTIVMGQELTGCVFRAHPLDDQKRKYVSADDVAEIREEARRRPVWMCRAQPGDGPDEVFEVKRGRVAARIIMSVARPNADESGLALCSGATADSRYAFVPTEEDRAAAFFVRDDKSQMLLETVYHQAVGKLASLVITGGQKPVDVAAGRSLDGIDLLGLAGIEIVPSSVKRPTTSYEVAIDACGSCCLGFDAARFGKISVSQLQRELTSLVALSGRLKSVASGVLKVGHRRSAAGSIHLTNYSRSLGPTQQMIEAMSMLQKMGFTATASLCRVLGAEGNWHSEVVFYNGDGRVHRDPLVVLVCSAMQQKAAAGRRKMVDYSMASRK